MKNYDTWARRVNNREDVPATFMGFFSSVTANVTEFPYTIFVPPDRIGRRKAIPKLICLLNDEIMICEKHNKDFKTIHIPLKDISLLESGTVLLYSWIKILGTTPDGPITTIIEFNSVVKEIFRPLIETVRLRCSGLVQAGEGDEALKRERVKFNIYAKSHYKFMNYAAKSILPGENVLDQVLQPDVVVRFMKYFHKLAVTSHLTILTNHELIIIRDPDTLRHKNQTPYGGIWSFVPLGKIYDVSIVEQTVETNSKKRAPDNLLTMNIVLTDKNSVNSQFDSLQQLDLMRLIQKVKTIERECG